MKTEFCNDPLCSEFGKRMEGENHGNPSCLGKRLARTKEDGLRLFIEDIKRHFYRINTMLDDGTITINEKL